MWCVVVIGKGRGPGPSPDPWFHCKPCDPMVYGGGVTVWRAHLYCITIHCIAMYFIYIMCMVVLPNM
jgi:hypothetical protein